MLIAAFHYAAQVARRRVASPPNPAGLTSRGYAHLDAVKLNQPRAIAVADITGKGQPGLVVTQLGGAPLVLRNEGGNQHNWMSIDLKALNDNKSGSGRRSNFTRLRCIKSGKWPVLRAIWGRVLRRFLPGSGRSATPKSFDCCADGVPQDEINLAPRRCIASRNFDRRGSSCPVLFSWNGHEYEFIADMIGPGVVGHWVGPGEKGRFPDPDEYLKVAARSVKPRNGNAQLAVSWSRWKKQCISTQVRLLAIDHPVAYEVFPNERFVSAPPFPEFGVIATRDAHVPIGAWDDKGNDVLGLISKRDRKYVRIFRSAVRRIRQATLD